MNMKFLALVIVACVHAYCSAAPVMLSNVGESAVKLMESFSNSVLPKFSEYIGSAENAIEGSNLLDMTAVDASNKKKDKEDHTGGGVRAPQILYSVTVTNPSTKPVNVTVEFSDSHGNTETETVNLKPSESRYFGQRFRSEGFWTSSMVVSAVTVECEGRTYTLPSKSFGMASTTEHLSFSVTGAGTGAGSSEEALGLKP